MTDQDTTDRSNKPMFYDPTEHRIRSFVTRAGRLSTAQARAIEELGPHYCVPYAKAHLDIDACFGRTAPTIFEIGFGMGETSAHIAALMAEKNFIGVEVHTPGVGSLLKMIGEQQLANLRLIQHDAVEVLTHMIARESLTGAHVFFSGPVAQGATQQAAAAATTAGGAAGVTPPARWLFALRDRLARLCGTDANGVECRADATQYCSRFCRTPRLSARYQV